MVDAALALMVAMQCSSDMRPQCLRDAAVHVLIERHESGGQNIFNWLHDTAPHYYTASGYYQITDSTWREGAGMAGVNVAQYPTAISAPYAVQKRVADALLNRYGIKPWQMDGPLMAALQNIGATEPRPSMAKTDQGAKAKAATTLSSQISTLE